MRSVLPVLLFFAAMACLGLILISVEFRPHYLIQQRFAVGFCTVMALISLVQLLRPGPELIIDEKGIHDKNFFGPTGFHPWEKIADARFRAIGVFGAPLTVLAVTRSDQFTWNRRAPFGARMQGLMGLRAGPFVAVMIRGMTATRREIGDAVREFSGGKFDPFDDGRLRPRGETYDWTEAGR